MSANKHPVKPNEKAAMPTPTKTRKSKPPAGRQDARAFPRPRGTSQSAPRRPQLSRPSSDKPGTPGSSGLLGRVPRPSCMAPVGACVFPCTAREATVRIDRAGAGSPSWSKGEEQEERREKSPVKPWLRQEQRGRQQAIEEGLCRNCGRRGWHCSGGQTPFRRQGGRGALDGARASGRG